MHIALNNGSSVDITGKKIVIGTGARTNVPKLEGLEEAGYVTSESLFGGKYPKTPYKSLIIVGGGVIALLVHNNSRRSRGAGTAKTPAQAANMPGMSVAETVTLANRQLLSADEQVRSAADELDFARAQFGIAATDEFARTLEAARAAVARGF